MVTRVAHLTTAHARGEVRVFLKECCSLRAANYDVFLVVADGRGNDSVRGVTIVDAGSARGRFQRMIVLPWRMLSKARGIKARLYHLHEPELLLIALFLRIFGAQVVYDSHEDFPRAVLSRDWIPWVLRRAVSIVFETFENFVTRRISAVVGATAHITERFSKLNRRSVTISNYPLPAEISLGVDRSDTGRVVCYLGQISRYRGIFEMVRALERVDVRLVLAGAFDSEETSEAVRRLPGWNKVDYRGLVSREQVLQIMGEARAGLLFFHPEPNHVDAQPNKMFEYMSAGLPVLASDFPLWRALLAESDAGICANPLDPEAIAETIRWVLDNPALASAMGKRGREAVLNRYQWTFEERKLNALYAELLA